MIANSDDSYNKKSHYGTFCGVSASGAKKELPDYFNKGDDVARTILNNLKGKISGEEGNYDDNCSAFINVVSETLDIKEVYSISEILNGHVIANDISYYLAQEDYNEDYSNLYKGICDSYIQGKPNNNNYKLLVAQYNLKNDLSYENIVNYNNQKAIAEEFKFNSKIDALTDVVAVNKDEFNNKIDELTGSVADYKGFLNSLQKSHKDLNTQVDNHSKSLQNLETTVNFHDESLESLISASKKIITEEVGAQEVNAEVDSHHESDM